jgi:hypothetical protein
VLTSAGLISINGQLTIGYPSAVAFCAPPIKRTQQEQSFFTSFSRSLSSDLGL